LVKLCDTTEILHPWKYDAHRLEVAEEEEAGMGVRRPEMFDLVVAALHDLGEADDTEQQSPPTK
jgi:nitrate/TMAO reductase-like tetraheme cytochrome c subunit